MMSATSRLELQIPQSLIHYYRVSESPTTKNKSQQQMQNQKQNKGNSKRNFNLPDDTIKLNIHHQPHEPTDLYVMCTVLLESFK